MNIKLFFPLLFLVLFSGLSCQRYAYTVAYNNLDFILLREINSYFSLTGDQKSFVEKRLVYHHVWHRKEVLPVYAENIRYIQGCVKNGFSEGSAAKVFVMAQSEVKRVSDRISDDAAEFFSSLSTEQIDHFSGRLEEYNRKASEKIEKRKIDPDQSRLKMILSFLNNFYGEFDQEQKKKISAIILSVGYVADDDLYLRYLRESQADFLKLLRGRPGKKDLKKRISFLLTRDKKFIPKYYLEKLNRDAETNRKLLVMIDREVVTKKQRDEGVSRLQEVLNAIESVKNE